MIARECLARPRDGAPGRRARPRHTAIALAIALAVLLPAVAARAEEAPADTALQRYFRSISDSTDAYFGLSAQPADTTGLDSTLVHLLDHPDEKPRQRGRSVTFAPSFAFNRAIAVLYGGSASVGSSSRLGRLTGALEWVNGPDDWYGGGEYALGRSRAEDEAGWSFRLRAGRRYLALDRDYFDPGLRTAVAFFSGGDRYSYLRGDGVRAEFKQRWSAWWGALGYRNELESPLATTATWNLVGADLDLVPNLPATLGRASEVQVHAGGELPRLPFKVEGSMWNAGGALGGDLGYHRYRGAAGGAIGLGRHFALAPQAEYGRLTGTALPQDAFWVGGQYSLVTVDSQSLQGTGHAAGRVELLMHDDLLEVLRLRRNAALPIQLAGFATSASRWGYDPATGEAQLTPLDWPAREQWISEAGVSLLFRVGLPDPESFFRVDYAWPVGPSDREPTWFLGYRRTLHMLGRP